MSRIMNVETAGRYLACAFVSAAMLAGCGANTAAVPAGPAQQLLVNPASVARETTMPPVTPKQSSFMYTAQFYGHDVKIYQRNGLTLTYEKTIAGKGLLQPQGTVTTPNGWWYVANGSAANVLIFKTTKRHGVRGPVGSLDDTGQVPVNVDLNPSRRLVAVSNGSTAGGGAGSVSVYVNRATEPSRTLTYGSDVLQGEGVAVDHQGNCYWSFNDGRNGGSIVEFAGCSGSGSIVATLPVGIAGGLAFDQNDDLFYVDQSSGIYRCTHTSNCKLWVPVGSELGIPTNINFDYKSKYLWVADASGYIDAIDPKGNVTRIPAQDGPSDPPFGIAPEPGA